MLLVTFSRVVDLSQAVAMYNDLKAKTATFSAAAARELRDHAAAAQACLEESQTHDEESSHLQELAGLRQEHVLSFIQEVHAAVLGHMCGSMGAAEGKLKKALCEGWAYECVCMLCHCAAPTRDAWSCVELCVGAHASHRACFTWPADVPRVVGGRWVGVGLVLTVRHHARAGHPGDR